MRWLGGAKKHPNTRYQNGDITQVFCVSEAPRRNGRHLKPGYEKADAVLL
jgi:hypothetical protein